MKDRLVQLERAERLLVKNTNKGKGTLVGEEHQQGQGMN
jgi:hypothetical protein